MAGLKGTISTSAPFAAAAGAARTPIYYTAPANSDSKLRGFLLMCDDATATDRAAVGSLARMSAAGSGGSAIAAAAIVHDDLRFNTATYPFVGTGRQGDTTAATVDKILMPLALEQKNSGIVFYYPPGEEPVIPRGTSAGINITPSADISGVVAALFIEE